MGTKFKFPAHFEKYWIPTSKLLNPRLLSYNKQLLLTGAFDFTALFADKVVSISEAAQRAEGFARLAGSVVVERLISALNHAR